MNYLCQYSNGIYFVMYSIKDMSQYIKTSTRLSVGGDFYRVIQTLQGD
jgi:hypothetical protein